MPYKEWLLYTEEKRPLWYRLSDTLLTAYGTVCFATSVVQPSVAAKYHFNELEDFINVYFVMRFLLLFWSNGFNLDWLISPKALLDLASCLPVLAIPARFAGSQPLSKFAELLQITRFLRLLREALPAGSEGRQIPLEQQLSAVLVSLLGTVGLSATILFLFENPESPVWLERSFDDCVIYMVDIFANREPPWTPEQPFGKRVSASATFLTIIFIPFLVARSLEVFMGSGAQSIPRLPAMFGAQQVPGATTRTAPSQDDALCWARLLRQLDMLEGAGLLPRQEARELRRRCRMRDPELQILDLCYGEAAGASTSAVGGGQAQELYAVRLREMLADGAGNALLGSEDREARREKQAEAATMARAGSSRSALLSGEGREGSREKDAEATAMAESGDAG